MLQDADQEGDTHILKIEDLLRFMGDTRVDVLKEELCKSLEGYDKQIKELKEELLVNSQNAEILREKNRRAKNKFITVHPSQTCELCYNELLSKAFFIFHCGHGFHRDCLIDHIETYETKSL